MKIFALSEGSYSVDATKKFIPFNPLTDNYRERPASLFIHVNPFLLKTDNDLIVLDTGLGYKGADGELILFHQIRASGFRPEDVTLVLMSHLHYDHSGGLVLERDGGLVPAFPDALHVVQKGEWETALASSTYSYHKEIFEALEGKINLQLVEGSGVLKPGIRYELSGGHAPFHQVFWFDIEGDKVFFGGDELPEPEQLIRKFIAKYDFDGRKAMELRAMYGEIAANDNQTCLFYHAKTLQAGKVSFSDGHFKINPA